MVDVLSPPTHRILPITARTLAIAHIASLILIIISAAAFMLSVGWQEPAVRWLPLWLAGPFLGGAILFQICVAAVAISDLVTTAVDTGEFEQD